MLEFSGFVMQTHLNRLHYIESQITPACLPSTNSASSEIKFFEYKDTCIPVHVHQYMYLFSNTDYSDNGKFIIFQIEKLLHHNNSI